MHHVGTHYEVLGPHLSEPSPQRTPLLFQAGSSPRGRAFAAKHAECVFIVTSRQSLRGASSIIHDIRTQAVGLGRHPDDVRFFQGLSPVVGGTEAEAKAKEAAYSEQFTSSPQVTPRTTGYDYGAKWGIAPTGLPPASTTVSLAALPPVGPVSLGAPPLVGTLLRSDGHHALLGALRSSLTPRYLAHFWACVVSLTGS